MQNSLLSYEKICPGNIDEERIVVQFSDSDSKVFINEFYCVNPACSCSEVTLNFIELSENGNLLKQLFTIRVDMVDWKVTDKKNDSKKSISDKMMKEFQDHLEDIKGSLISHLMQAKDYGRRHYIDYLSEHAVSMLQGGAMVSYSEIFGSVDTDVFSFEKPAGERWFIEDQYCSNPKCQCNDVVLSFYRHDSSVEIQEAAFVVRMKLKSFKYDIENFFCKKELIAEIMRFLQLNKPQLFTVTQRRYRDIKEAGKAARRKFNSEEKIYNVNGIQNMLEESHMPGVQDSQVIRKTVKVNRNDPCPCGSGIKYKKCCGR